MPHNTRHDTTEAVDALMAGLKHPPHDGIQALSKIVLAADPGIREGVKWNAPSLRTREYFATTHLRSKVGFGLILHRGAKGKAVPEGGLAIPDPEGLLRWLAPDRAAVELQDSSQLLARGPALQTVIVRWTERL